MDDSTLSIDTSRPIFHLSAHEKNTIARRYESLEAVGHGGMGIVFRGRDKTLGRDVALKICRPDSNIERLRREAIALAHIRSPNVVTVHDFETISDDRGMLVMDWIEGRDLASMISDSSFNLDQESMLQWMCDVCQGMITAGLNRIIHRDLKPSNILIDRNNRALITDFGLASVPMLNQLSTAGQILGTPFYMAPEQAEDPRNVDARADIYSFGATFYHAFTRHPPFQGDSLWAVVLKHKTEPLVPPRSHNTSIPAHINDCIERCMAKNPADRFPTFSDVLSILQSPLSFDAWGYTEDDVLRNYLGVYGIHRDELLTPRNGRLEDPVIFDFPNRRRLKVYYGDLSQEKVDAVVSSDDARLTMSGGVSLSLLRNAGEALRTEAQRFVPVRPGRVVVTSGASLPARFVFHGVTIGVEGGNLRFPTRDVIAEIVDSCFYQAETLSIESIALPLLGTGTGGFPRGVALDTIFRAIAHRLLTRASSIKEVRVVLHPPK